MHGPTTSSYPTCIVWANLTPFSLQLELASTLLEHEPSGAGLKRAAAALRAALKALPAQLAVGGDVISTRPCIFSIENP